MFGTAATGLRTYWHNRVGLELVQGAQPPELEAPTLDPLLPWLRGFNLSKGTSTS
jgi:2-haloacid dehalogenase